MKQTVAMVLASTILVAGVASASVFAPSLDQVTAKTAVRVAAASAAANGVTANGPVSTKPVQAPGHAVEAHKAPVPLIRAVRPVSRHGSVTPAPAEAARTTPTAPILPAEDEEAARSAKAAIERDGYKAVKVLAKAPDGSWRARAMRGQTEIGVTVDTAGRVSAD